MLTLQHLKADRSVKKIRVKIEIDTNPPAGAQYETKYLVFPFAASVTMHDCESLFAGKMHALLCREYTKGRDWYDLIWYCARKIELNTTYLQSALKQQGEWKDKDLNVTKKWWLDALREKIQEVNIDAARNDAIRFVRVHEQPTLSVWSKEFFLAIISG